MARTVDPELHRARRLQVLDAAVSCFAERGYAATTTSQISAAAGMSSGHLYHYFASKQAIFLGIFEYDEEETAAIVARAEAASDPLEGLLGMVDAMAADVIDPRAAGLGLAVLERVRHDAELAELMARVEARRHAAVVGLLERVEAAGRLEVRQPHAQSASWILGLVDVLFTRAGNDGFEPAAQLPLLQRTVRELVGAGDEPRRGRRGDGG